MNLYLGHLDLLSRLLRSAQLVNTITCEITDPASPYSVFGFFMGRSPRSLFLGYLELL